MVVAALLPERTLVAEALPSRFGGGHNRLAAGPRRVNPVSLAVSDGVGGPDDDDGLDVARLLSRPLVAGQAKRVASLLRRLPDGPSVATVGSDAPQGNALPVVLAAWARALSARGVDRLEVMPRLRGADAFAAVALACQEAGIAVETLSPRHERPLLLLDDGELVHWPSWRVVADAGQYAMLGAGLAPDVAAAIIEAAGVDGHEVWDKGFDDVARTLFVQRLERAIRSAGDGVQPGVVRLTMATLLPALSSSTSKVAALMQLPNVSERVLSLAQQHRARQQQQRAAVARLVFELRLPSDWPTSTKAPPSISCRRRRRCVSMSLPPSPVTVSSSKNRRRAGCWPKSLTASLAQAPPVTVVGRRGPQRRRRGPLAAFAAVPSTWCPTSTVPPRFACRQHPSTPGPRGTSRCRRMPAACG